MKSARDDRVYRALATPRRRRILAVLREHPGMNASELARRFPFTRIAVLKHLRVLEQSGLITRRRVGRAVEFRVDEEPLAGALERTLAACRPIWIERLRGLKTELEREGPSMASPRHVYVTYIRTTPERLWESLTRPELTQQFFFGTGVKCRFEKGAPIEYVVRTPDGREIAAVTGEVVEVVPLKRLVHTFRFPRFPDAPTRVSYEIETAGEGIVKLTLTHEGFDGETKTWREVGGGWPRVVAALKTLLETGKALDIE